MQEFKFSSELFVIAESEEEAREKFEQLHNEFASNTVCIKINAYSVYLKDKKDDHIVDVTSIDEDNIELGKELFSEAGYDLKDYNIEIEPA